MREEKNDGERRKKSTEEKNIEETVREEKNDGENARKEKNDGERTKKSMEEKNIGESVREEKNDGGHDGERKETKSGGGESSDAASKQRIAAKKRRGEIFFPSGLLLDRVVVFGFYLCLLFQLCSRGSCFLMPILVKCFFFSFCISYFFAVFV